MFIEMGDEPMGIRDTVGQAIGGVIERNRQRYEDIIASQLRPGENIVAFQDAQTKAPFLIRILPYIGDLFGGPTNYLLAITDRRILIIRFGTSLMKAWHLKELTASIPYPELAEIEPCPGMLTSSITIRTRAGQTYRFVNMLRSAAEAFARDVELASRAAGRGDADLVAVEPVATPVDSVAVQPVATPVDLVAVEPVATPPEMPAPQRTKCPGCGVALKGAGIPAGKTLRCPKCGHRFRVPIAAAPAALPVATPVSPSRVAVLAQPDRMPGTAPPVALPVATPAAAPAPAAVRVLPVTATTGLFGLSLKATLLLGGGILGVVLAGGVGIALLKNNVGPGPGPGPVAISSEQIEWERKLALLQAEVGKAADNPLLVQDAEKKVASYIATTLAQGKTLNGWVGILTDVRESQTYFQETRGGKVVYLPPQPCYTATVVLSDLSQGANWPALTVTTAEPVTKTVVKGFDLAFREIKRGRLVQVWGKIHPPNGVVNMPDGATIATITVSKIEPFDHLAGRQPTLKLIKPAEDNVAKLRAANKEIGKQRPWGSNAENGPREPGPLEYSLFVVDPDEDYRLFIGIAAKYPEYRQAVLSFNKFTPQDHGSTKALEYFAATQTRLETVRFLNEQKEHEDVRALAEKLAKASSEAEHQVKNLKLIEHHLGGPTRDPSVAKISYRELPPEVRKEVDRDKYAFIPFPPPDRSTRPNPVPHEDAGKGVPPPPKPTPSPTKGAPTKGAPAKAVTFDGKRYLVFTDVVTWHAAKERCEQQGGRLAIVTSANQNQFLTKLVLDSGLKEAWLGATDEKKEGSWVWVDGRSMGYKNWGKGQPNNTGGREHYLLLWAASNGQWADQPAMANASVHRPGYICEWE
jgi:hypothetical protein